MKRIYVNEEWCLGCHLCEYNCAFANSNISYMAKALKNKKIYPRISVKTDAKINFAVSCRHCEDPLCVRTCIAQALQVKDGRICIDKNRCIGCFSCIMVCPYGALSVSENGTVQKCELCLDNICGKPACVEGCPNEAIVYEER